MEWLAYVYLAYMFVSIYFLSFFLLSYFRNRKNIFESPELKKHFSVSVLIPAYNEEDSIKATVDSVFESDYNNIVEVIVINDGSKDRTAEIVKDLKKKYSKLILIDKKNSGKGDSLNHGIKIARGELIAVVDSDSFPDKDAIRKCVGFFENERVGAATVPILSRNKGKFFEKLQSIEYSVIALTRKLLEGVDGIYVTPGPLALYRKTALKEIGGFDSTNLTEDIEITWHLTKAGWQRKMCLNTKVTTIVPDKIRAWFRQRQRWSMGGMQTILKYKKEFLKKGMVGFFILPFFLLSTFMGLVGLGVFSYLVISRFIREYLIVKYSIISSTSIISLNDLYFNPSILNYLGFVLFIMGTIFTFLILILMKEDIFRKDNFFSILFYLIVYMAIYPFILITAMFKLIRRDMSW